MPDNLEQAELPGLQSSEDSSTNADIEHIASLDGAEFQRALYAFLSGMRLGKARTTVAVKKDYADIVYLIARKNGISFSDVLGIVIAEACENMSHKASKHLNEISNAIGDILETMDELESQLDAATDAVLMGSYGNAAASVKIPESLGRAIGEKLSDMSAPKGAADE